MLSNLCYMYSSIHSYACSLVHSELSCRGLKSSLHLHVAHTHYGSHYSVRSPYLQAVLCELQTSRSRSPPSTLTSYVCGSWHNVLVLEQTWWPDNHSDGYQLTMFHVSYKVQTK
jgi:hypothetical protein